MKVRFWGTRGGVAVPSIETIELGGNTSCTEITLDNGKSIIVDAGTGIIELGERGTDLQHEKEFHILISHFHWDHILGFPFFLPIHVPTVTINLYATCEVTELKSRIEALFDGTYSPLHGLKNTKAHIEFHKIAKEGIPINEAFVRAHKTDHPDLCDAFRIEHNKKAVSLTSDHEVRRNEKNEQLIKFISGSDILVHDGEFTSEQYETKIGWGHSTIENAIKNAIAAKAKTLLLTHHNANHSDDFLRFYLLKTLRNKPLAKEVCFVVELAEENRSYSC